MYLSFLWKQRQITPNNKTNQQECLSSGLFPYNSNRRHGLRRLRFKNLHRTPNISPAQKQTFFFLTASSLFQSENTQKFLQETLHRTGCPDLPSNSKSPAPSHRLRFPLSIKVLSRTPGTCLIQWQARFTL